MQSEFDLIAYRKRMGELFLRFQSVQSVGFNTSSYKPGLEGMERLDSMLGSPWKRYPCIHVAGTNGKGSVCSMIASALGCGGRRVGLYTSPHLLDFRERIKLISGNACEMISPEDVWEFLEMYEARCVGLSFFEITTGMALWWFARKGVDAAVVETGLGGRLDSTNIISPALTVISSIGLDHCALLGNTLEEIAAEKAGIFKKGVAAVVGTRDAAPVFMRAADEVGAPLIFVGDVPSYASEPAISRRMDLRGPCREINLHTALVALEEAAKGGRIPMPDAACITEGLCKAAARTHLHGRWERLHEEPETICDIGHNPQALQGNFDILRGHIRQGRSLIVVFGIMADKDLGGIAPLMPSEAIYLLAAPGNPRALPPEELRQRLGTLRPDLRCRSVGSVESATQMALEVARDLPNPLIYIGGSTFVVSEAMQFFQNL